MTAKATTRKPAKPAIRRRQPLSAEAQRWFDALVEGWDWEPHELQILMTAAEAFDRYSQARTRARPRRRHRPRPLQPAARPSGPRRRARLAQRAADGAEAVALRGAGAGRQPARPADTAREEECLDARRRSRRGSSRWRSSRWNSLSFGPWKAEAPDGGPFGRRRFSDSELAEHWQWAKLEPPPGHRGVWDEKTWAYRVFELGETSEQAFRRCRRLQWARLDRAGDD